MERDRFDYHIHSSFSDGQNSVEEIIKLAYEDVKNGSLLKAISITDHNMIALPEKVEVGEKQNIMVLYPGCEFSTLYHTSEEKNIEVHVVGIWKNSVNPADFVPYFSLETVVQKILKTNGLPVLCHAYDYRLNAEEIELLVKNFTTMSDGIAGLEVYYERYLKDPEKIQFLNEMADKYGLAKSAASDRHRSDQPFASGGTEYLYRKISSLFTDEGKNQEIIKK